MNQERLFIWKYHCKGLGWAANVVGQCLRESPKQGNSSDSQVDGDTDMVPLAGSVAGDGLSKGTIASASTSV